MKKYRIQYSILAAVLLVFILLQFSKTKLEEKINYKKFKTTQELKNETILYKKNRRANGWAKPDKPSEFLKYHNSIRTKAGDSKPNYPNNYKIKELKKALNNNTLLKSSTLELDWIERGPGNCSGRTRGLIIDPSDNSRNTWYTGSVGGGIWKTTNAGESWKNLTTNLPNLSTVSLAMPKSNTNIIYAGTGEGFYNSDAISGNGIFKSIDKGETWEQLESTTSNSNFSFVNRIVVDPNNEAIVLAATNTSIQKSIDGGTTWLTVFDDDSRIQHIIAHPSDFSILYASVNAGGVIKSTDAGETWRYIFEENTGRIELAIAPSEPETIYALNENSQLYISYNSGSEWSPAKVISGTKEQFLSDQGWYNNAINVSPDNPNLLVIGGVNLYKVEIIGTSSSTTSFINIKAIGTSSFMEFINHGADYLYGSMDVNSTKKNYTNIEVQFGPGKAQMAHRFVVPRGETSGVDAIDYTYTDYVEVPFEVWDVENNRQLMVSFRDQDRNNKFNLAPFDDNELTGREYIWINDIDYSTTASGLISVNGGHEYEEIITWWSVLADGATWDDKNLPESKIKITRTDVFQKELSSKKIADWAGLGAPYVHADLHNIQFTKTQNGDTRIIVANDGGVGYSDDLGDTWTNPTNGYNTTQFYGVDKHPTSNRYTGGLQDNGSWLSPENPNNLSKWEETTGGDGFDGVWHAIDPNRIITTIYYNSLNISNDGGNTWGGLGGFADEGSGNAPFITQIGYSPTSPDKLYIVGKSGVTVSDDFGNSWTLSAIEKANWGWTGNGFVEPSIANPEVVWAGSQMSEEGQIQLSTDGGKTFNSTNNSIEEMGSISGIATHPLDENIAYALFSFNDFAKILRTTNMGDSWEDISGFDFLESNNGFPNVAVYSLLIMPHNPEIIWVGTEIGLFISNNNGLTWNYANNGLPAVSIWELKIRGNQVIAATHGRGIWTVDIPEIALALKAPILIDVATSPTNETLIKIKLESNFDSIYYTIDNQEQFKLNTTSFSTNTNIIALENKLDEGFHTINLSAYKDDKFLKSVTKSFVAIKFNNVQSIYSNTFDVDSNDFIGEGYTIKNIGSIGTGNAIHSEHPYPDNSNLSYYLKTPIKISTIDKVSTLTYKDIPLVEEGYQSSKFGSSNFYDYVIVEGSKDGFNWLPVLNGYDFRKVKFLAQSFDKTVNDKPLNFMFINHEVNLSETFAEGDTIILRFRLYADLNTNGWGWIIDNIDIKLSEITSISNHLISENSIYPIPCNDHLTIELSDNYNENSILTVFDLKGRKVLERSIRNENEVLLNTFALDPSIYILEIKSGKNIERKRIQIAR